MQQARNSTYCLNHQRSLSPVWRLRRCFHHKDRAPHKVARFVLVALAMLTIAETVVNLCYLEVNSSVPEFTNVSHITPFIAQVASELCQEYPSTLRGHSRLKVNPNLSLENVTAAHREVRSGGSWEPSNCTARYKIAIIVPYRDREKHLVIFLDHLHSFLQRQQLAYTIYVVEQDMESKFNRGMLLNIGFTEAEKLTSHDCFFFHDVDLLPENDKNLYSCPHQPRHVSVAVDKLRYKLPYIDLFGGIEAFSKEHFEQINGFSNVYFGWGAEDDDLFMRLTYHGLNLTRFAPEIARYKMLSHRADFGREVRILLGKRSQSPIVTQEIPKRLEWLVAQKQFHHDD